MSAPIRMAAIDFLNPAPLMWSFEHEPDAERLKARYRIAKMAPASCAAALAENRADLGLIPVGAYPENPELLIVPGCAIASLGAIRSLLLVIRADAHTEAEPEDEPDLQPPTPGELARIGTVALDSASRTSALYTQILFRRYWGQAPRFASHAPDLEGMLAVADAALLIGDPALRALRDRGERARRTGERLRYLDLGQLWREAAGVPWVSAFWAVRRESFEQLPPGSRLALLRDLERSRDEGLRHIPELVREWAPQLHLSPRTVEQYLARNIHYRLDAPVIAGIEQFLQQAYALKLLPTLPPLRWAL